MYLNLQILPFPIYSVISENKYRFLNNVLMYSFITNLFLFIYLFI